MDVSYSWSLKYIFINSTHIFVTPLKMKECGHFSHWSYCVFSLYVHIFLFFRNICQENEKTLVSNGIILISRFQYANLDNHFCFWGFVLKCIWQNVSICIIITDLNLNNLNQNQTNVRMCNVHTNMKSIIDIIDIYITKEVL